MRRLFASVSAFALAVFPAAADQYVLPGVVPNGAVDANTLFGQALASREAAVAYLATDFGAKCDGSTDDTNAEKALILAGAALSVQIELAPRGKTCITNQLGIPSNSHVRVDGTLKLLANANQNVLVSNGVTSNVIIEGEGTIDGNASNETGTLACIYNIGASSNWTIGGAGRLTIQNCKNFPINFVGGVTASFTTEAAWTGAKHIRFQHLNIIGGGNSTEFAQGCYDCSAIDLNINGTADYGFAFYTGCFVCGLYDSTIINSAGGVTVLADGQATGTTSTPSNTIKINRNHFAYNNAAAIIISNTAGTGVHQNIEMIGNTGDHNNQGNIANYGGEYINAALNVKSLGNSWSYDGNGTASSVGIFVGAASRFQSISDTIFNEGQGGALGVGITISSSADNWIIDAATIYDNQSTKTMAYDLNGNAGINTFGVVSNSNLGGSIGKANNLVPSVDTREFNNPSSPNLIPDFVSYTSGEAHATTTVTASFTFNAAQRSVEANATSAAIVGTLPACVAAIKGYEFKLKSLKTSTFAVSFGLTGSDTIDGATSLVLSNPGDNVTVQCSDTAGRWDRG